MEHVIVHAYVYMCTCFVCVVDGSAGRSVLFGSLSEYNVQRFNEAGID